MKSACVTKKAVSRRICPRLREANLYKGDKMIYIENVYANEVLDSRGNPTLRASVVLSDGSIGHAIVPSGASTGSREALELRDNDKSRYNGKGVLMACENVDTKIADVLVGASPLNQDLIDHLMLELELDSGGHGYTKLGANAVLGVSMAVSRAAAACLGMPLYRYLGGAQALTLPVPMLNIINGGAHANNSVDFQEYMIMPLGFDSFSRALQASAETYHALKKLLDKRGFSTSIGDEGGFAPSLANNTEPLEFIMQAIEEAGYKVGEDIAIALDIAASELRRDDGRYELRGENRILTSSELVDLYAGLVDKYPIVSIEDGLGEDDWDGWRQMTKRLGSRIQLVGDDLFVTDAKILKNGIEEGVANSILIKPNQIGSISETIDTILLAKRSGYSTVVSHRSGESEDTYIADLAVALNTAQIKTGSTARSERMAKYNRLLEIERNLVEPRYLGHELFRR